MFLRGYDGELRGCLWRRDMVMQETHMCARARRYGRSPHTGARPYRSRSPATGARRRDGESRGKHDARRHCEQQRLGARLREGFRARRARFG